MLLIFSFLLIYFILDALHDTWSKREKDKSVAAANYFHRFGNTATYRALINESLKWNKAKHAIDAWIKGYVLGFIAYYINTPELTGWVLVLQVGKFMLLGASLRWLTFDISWNAFNRMPFFYRGTVAQTDTIKIKDWLYFTIKILLVAGSILFIVL